jgi:hypothetical protein
VDNVRPEARGPLKSGDWGGRPTCHPQTPPVVQTLKYQYSARFIKQFLIGIKTVHIQCLRAMPSDERRSDKRKVVLVQAMKACSGSRGIASLIPKLGTTWN